MSTVVNRAGTGAAAAPALSPQEIAKQIKPLSNNSFAAFFQRIWRAWLSFWYWLSDKHPRFTKVLYMIFFFVLFSQAVTVFQWAIFNFGPLALKGTGLAGNNWGFPLIKMGTHNVTGEDVYFRILGASPRYNADGTLIDGIGAGGLAYFIMFMIGTFLAQCINFPLQRNITFRSHGNPWYQAMWYLVGWILIQPVTMAIGSAWEGLRDIYLGAWPGFVTTLLNTVIMGGVSMVIFFFIFLIIFPDYNGVEKRARKKLEKLKAGNADAEKLAKAEAAVADAAMKAKLSNTEKAAAKAATQASSRAMAYFATVNAAEKAKVKAAELEKTAGADKAKLEKARKSAEDYSALAITRQTAASEAVDAKDKAAEAFKAAKAEAETFKKTKAQAT